MVGLALKIIIAAFILMFLDLLITTMLGGQIELQGEYFTLITLLIRLFEILAAFLVLIVHLLTHILDPDAITQDISLLIEGISSVFMWIVGSLIDLIIHMVRIPFAILTDLISLDGIFIEFGLSGTEDEGWALSLGSLLIDLRHLTIVVVVPNIKLDIAGVNLIFRNTIAFSFLGVDNATIKVMAIDVAELARSGGESIIKKVSVPSSYRLDEFMSIFISLEDYAWTKPGIKVTIPILEVTLLDVDAYLQVPPFIKFPITFPLSATDPDISMQGLIQGIIDGLGIPTPVEWMDNVYSSVIPALGSPSTILTEIQNNIKVRKCQITQMI